MKKVFLLTIALYQNAAEKGYADAQFRLGRMYDRGQGVEEDTAKAAEWFLKAAEQGNAFAQFNMGYMFEYGEGVTKDFEKAKEWYERSAEQGVARSQFNLALMYLEQYIESKCKNKTR